MKLESLKSGKFGTITKMQQKSIIGGQGTDKDTGGGCVRINGKDEDVKSDCATYDKWNRILEITWVSPDGSSHGFNYETGQYM